MASVDFIERRKHMRKFLIITHGEFAKGIAQSLTLFLGEDHPFHAISAYVDGNTPHNEINAFMNTVSADDELIILTDILGGSVNQLMIPYMQRENTYIIAGFNFPLLLELNYYPEPATKEGLIDLVNNCKESLVLMNNYSFDELDSNDE